MRSKSSNYQENERRITEELNEIMGLENAKSIVENYIKYLKLVKNGEIKNAKYNILIVNSKNEINEENLIKLLHRKLVEEKIINTEYIYSSKLKKEQGEKVKEDLIIIEEVNNLSREEKEYFLELNKEYPNKIYFYLGEKGYLKNKIAKEFKENIFWEIKLKSLSEDEKQKYILRFLMENNIEINRKSKLLKEISKNEIDEIKNILINVLVWCNTNSIIKIEEDEEREILKWLKTVIKELDENLAEDDEEKDFSSNPRKELEKMIGMKNIKEQLVEILNYIKVNKRRKNMPSLHMTFEGNPGTGKTTVARLIGQIFEKEKILSGKGKFVEAQRESLVGSYIGQTAPKTKEIIEKAVGSVLFIDEAYTLTVNATDSKDFGKECVATIIKEMEDKREDLCVILAGYTEKMEELLNSNPGFKSRIQFRLQFPDYTEIELYEIFRLLCKKEKYKIHAKCKETLIEYFKKEKIKEKENFSNGRCARNIFEKVKIEQANRIIKEKSKGIDNILKKDIENAISRINKTENLIKKQVIGFCR